MAGGSGLRMGHDVPKQFLPLGGLPILMHTINAFHRFDGSMRLVVVLPASQMDYWRELCAKHRFAVGHTVAEGGETRFYSVKNGLAAAIQGSVVAVHDGVRPFVSLAAIGRCFVEAQKLGNAIPVMPSIESIRQVTPTGSTAVDRSAYVMVQTPQVFRWEQIDAAYNLPFDALFTDDASVVEKAGFPIHLVEGNRENVKITTPFDLCLGEALLHQSAGNLL